MIEPVASRYAPATAEPADAGHLLPAEAWQAVVDGAAERREQLAETARRAAVDRTIAARSHGGLMKGPPRLGVLHSAETPLRAGYAYSIAANWFATQATTSATVMIDPAETIRLLPDNVVSYAVGPRANGFTINVEQAGRASMSEAEWVSPEAGLPQMVNVAEFMRDCRDRWALPLRWATDEQIRAAAAGGPPQGWCTHDDVRRVLGGTTHTDPGRNYPRARLMALAAGSPAAGVGTSDPHDEGTSVYVINTARGRSGILNGGRLFEFATDRERKDAAAATNNWTRLPADPATKPPRPASAPFAVVDDALWDRLVAGR